MSGPDAVAATLRELDRDRYYASLILAEPRRSAVQALYAAGAEIASVSERVSAPLPGEIRLKWWSDLLAGPPHDLAGADPVAAKLLATMERYRLAAGPLERLVAARRFDLYQDPMPDIASFEGYAGETVSILFQYAATILGDGQPPASGDAAGHLGVALAFFGHVRAFGFNAARGRIFLPFDIFKQEGVGEADIFARQDSPALRSALGRCRALGAAHLGKARAALGEVTRAVRPAFAQIVLVDARARPGDDSFAPPPPSPDWAKLARLMAFGFILR